MNRALSVYVHFPYCLSKCPYCDFVSYATERADIDHDGYADLVCSEIDARARALHDRAFCLQTVFFGGGTPSLWRPDALGRVLARIKHRFGHRFGHRYGHRYGARAEIPSPDGTSPELEVTVECNPTSLDKEVADALADQGVNRLSIGAQALRRSQLDFLGRLHDPRGAVRAIERALASRIPRVSADLIYGLPGQLPAEAADQAGQLADLGLSHLSCYELTIEPGTKFGELARAGRLPRAEDGAVVEAFFAIEEQLRARGLEHYEISNYARPGHEARHNLSYWRGVEYVGLGCGAFGFLRDVAGTAGVRYRNAVDPARYAQGARALTNDAKASAGVVGTEERLDPETLLRERIMLGLRLRSGFDLVAAGRDLGVSGWTRERERAAARLEGLGRLVRQNDVLCIPREAWPFANDVAARLM